MILVPSIAHKAVRVSPTFLRAVFTLPSRQAFTYRSTGQQTCISAQIRRLSKSTPMTSRIPPIVLPDRPTDNTTVDPVRRDFGRHRSATAPNEIHLETDVEANTHRRSTLSPGGGSLRSRKRSTATHMSFEDAHGITHRISRTNTVRKYHSQSPSRSPASWEEPGAEPGIDPSAQHFPARFKHLLRRCQITVVDFSADRMEKFELNNETLVEFMARPRPEWVQCRWLNVNGLSWDVIKILGNHYSLHRLAIEDMMNTTSRTKADWYRDSAYMLLTLQKLVRVRHEDSDSESDSEGGGGWFTRKSKRKRKLSLFTPWATLERKSTDSSAIDGTHHNIPRSQIATETVKGSSSDALHVRGNGAPFRTLQRYRGTVNPERAMYMERNSSLTKKNLAVSVEQVSVFLTQDQTVLSFFEHSADDIEEPILRRLSAPDTILRRSADPSMMVQAVLDAIVDLAGPVVAAYEDSLADLELDVLTDPEMRHSRLLYILSTELITLRNNMQPIANVIAALREHKGNTQSDPAPAANLSPAGIDKQTASNVTITPVASIYLGDVEDHTLQIVQNLDILRRTTSDLIDLIFNQMSSLSNESMRTLTTVTIFFLPLTFLTGYFGMNFTDFAGIENSDSFFWYISTPVMIVTILILTQPIYTRALRNMWQKLWINRSRKQRKERGRISRPS